MPPDFIRPAFLARPSFGTLQTLADGLGFREAKYRLRLRPTQVAFGIASALNLHRRLAFAKDQMSEMSWPDLIRRAFRRTYDLQSFSVVDQA
jgi:hypothetical protein